MGSLLNPPDVIHWRHFHNTYRRFYIEEFIISYPEVEVRFIIPPPKDYLSLRASVKPEDIPWKNHILRFLWAFLFTNKLKEGMSDSVSRLRRDWTLQLAIGVSDWMIELTNKDERIETIIDQHLRVALATRLPKARIQKNIPYEKEEVLYVPRDDLRHTTQAEQFYKWPRKWLRYTVSGIP